MQYEGCGFCSTTVECPMRGRGPPNEDVWLAKKWETEINANSLLEATLPPNPVEDEGDTYQAIVLASQVSALSNVEPSLFDGNEPLSPPLDAGALEQDTTMLVTIARKVTRSSHVDDASDKDIHLHRNEVGEPGA